MRTCAAQALPVEIGGGDGVGGKLGALGAFLVGIEDKAVRVDALEQHHADIGTALRIHRRQRHGVGVVGLARFRVLHPAREQREGIARRRDAAIIHRSADIAHDRSAVASRPGTG